MFAEFIAPEWADRGFHHSEYGQAVPVRRGDVLVYQMSTGSNVAEYVRLRSEPLIVNYHNFTPPEYFAQWEPAVVHGIEWGRHQRTQLADRAVLGIGDSAYNERDLVEAGYRRTAVCPVLIDPSTFLCTPSPAVVAELDAAKQAGGIDLLFVGRIAPNKCQHDLVKVLAAYRRAYDPNARLRIVGGSSADRYRDAVARYAAELGLAEAVELSGSVDGDTLAAYFDRADVFASMSEHEGFCVPVIEAMHHGVPVVAYSAAAVPETLGDAGIVLDTKSPERFAAAIHQVVGDRRLRDSLVAAGSVRAQDFAIDRTSAQMVELIREVVDGVPA